MTAQHVARQRSMLQDGAACCKTAQHVARQRSMLQDSAACCKTAMWSANVGNRPILDGAQRTPPRVCVGAARLGTAWRARACVTDECSCLRSEKTPTTNGVPAESRCRCGPDRSRRRCGPDRSRCRCGPNRSRRRCGSGGVPSSGSLLPFAVTSVPSGREYLPHAQSTRKPNRAAACTQ